MIAPDTLPQTQWGEQDAPDAPPALEAPAVARGVVPFLGRALLLAIPPLSMFWFRLANLPGLGNVTGTDAMLLVLWGLTLIHLFVRGMSEQDVDTPLIVVLAVLVGTLAAVCSELGPVPGNWRLEFLLFMKRFGFAAILPIAAARFRSPGMGTWTRILTVPTVGALVLFTFRPDLRDLLPRPEGWDPTRTGDRATSLLTNPNDLAYAAIALAVLHGALLSRGSGVVSRLLFLATLAGSATCVVMSGSRSGLSGSVAALLFLLAYSRIRRGVKATLFGVAAAAVLVGLTSSAVFRERVVAAYAMGAEEENVSARIDMQSLMVRLSAKYPLGVGYGNLYVAAGNDRQSFFHGTSDSVYLDTLAGAGLAGLAALLWLFWTAWRVAGSAGGARGHVLQAGVVAFLVFGLASIVPISVHLAPLFFTLVAAGVHARALR